jgi:hypothetical protein
MRSAGQNLSGVQRQRQGLPRSIRRSERLLVGDAVQIPGNNYGFLIDVPFAIADASGGATLEPVLSSGIGSVTPASLQRSPGSAKGTIGDIYFEPINLGWHLRQLDAIVAGGFFAPTGAYNSNANLNIGYGHWSGVLGVGGIAYADAERTWALSIYSHFILYASQMGRNYTLGEQAPLE